jgi:hypothetical protein
VAWSGIASTAGLVKKKQIWWGDSRYHPTIFVEQSKCQKEIQKTRLCEWKMSANGLMISRLSMMLT